MRLYRLIRRTEAGRQGRPEHLQAVKDEDVRRWGTLELLDVLKYADFLAAFTDDFTSLVSREDVAAHATPPPCCCACSRAGHVDTGRRLGGYGRAWPSAPSSNPATWQRTGASVWVARRLHMTALFDLDGLHVEGGWTSNDTEQLWRYRARVADDKPGGELVEVAAELNKAVLPWSKTV
ncbi:hypothetical protein ABN034_29010 [Actinopolymorpha sp. B11F2]|uniref:hypothetical protein n=1 Tax=Actinopolymorpha sp. B11F2 TaxID=3160862 RepID=UPI0032E4B2D5